MKQPILETSRLVLKPFDSGDGSDIQFLAGNYDVAKTTLGIPHPYMDGVAENWIVSRQHAWETKTGVSYAIRLRKSNQLIGDVSLVDMEPSRAELGYWIGKPFWGKGFCTEASKTLLKYAIEGLNIEHVVAKCLTSNPASAKVMEKIGMRHTSSIRLPDRTGQLAGIEVYELWAHNKSVQLSADTAPD